MSHNKCYIKMKVEKEKKHFFLVYGSQGLGIVIQIRRHRFLLDSYRCHRRRQYQDIHMNVLHMFIIGFLWMNEEKTHKTTK